MNNIHLISDSFRDKEELGITQSRSFHHINKVAILSVC